MINETVKSYLSEIGRKGGKKKSIKKKKASLKNLEKADKKNPNKVKGEKK